MVSSEWKGRLLLLTSSLLVVPAMLLIGEAYVRLFMPHVKFFGTSKNLIRDPFYGTTHGWVPDAMGVSYGAPIRIDHRGFREIGTPAQADSTLLLIGDSVTFGVGVEADSTFAGLLQHAHPSLAILNSASIGYALEDYHEVVDYLLARDNTVRRAIIAYSLNDYERTPALPPGALSFLNLRVFLRENSKLYVWIRGTFFDRSEIYFFRDYQFYAEPSPNIPNVLNLLGCLVEQFRIKKIECSVLILPYEYQLRMNEERYLLPQKILSDYLTAHNIPFVNGFSYFKNAGGVSKNFFLLGDHMHLSNRGHRTAFELIEKEVLR